MVEALVEVKKQARPFCCPEPRCTPIFSYNLYGPLPSTGESFICFGQMAEPVKFTYDGVEHVNNLNHCDYTPLKGIIRWQENKEDWEGVVKVFKLALEKLEEK
ncbi:hypothetical protein LCGC14_2055650 [marine sediment metagenome]|uniref:Uncharacterized protein n=1 Tax=marine sediment metagenome TaxID=412755 RepID=A0A0F9HJP5_9ZZZZ